MPNQVSRKNSSNYLKVLLGLLGVAVVISGAWPTVTPVRFVAPKLTAAHLRLTETAFALPVTTPSVHAAALAALPAGRLMAAWFGGTREGAKDVSIYLSRFDGHHWSAAQTIMTPAMITKATGHYTRKLGNPVLHLDTRGRLHLFVVSVALGGWGTAYIDHAVSSDNGLHFTNAERLHLSPFLNMSHLVRAPAISLADGGFLLPAYFEMGRKYPVMLRFDAEGNFLSRSRIPGPTYLLQPAVSVHGPTQAVAFTRDSGSRQRQVHFSRFSDANDSWTPSQPIPLPNPDSSVAVLPAVDGGHWMAANPSLEAGRRRLVLQKFDGSLTTKETLTVADAAEGEFSYPALARTDDGRVHLVYTDRRKGLTHRIFEANHD